MRTTPANTQGPVLDLDAFWMMPLRIWSVARSASSVWLTRGGVGAVAVVGASAPIAAELVGVLVGPGGEVIIFSVSVRLAAALGSMASDHRRKSSRSSQFTTGADKGSTARYESPRQALLQTVLPVSRVAPQGLGERCNGSLQKPCHT